MAKILIVDDEEDNLFYLKETLQMQKYTVAGTVTNSHDAISAAIKLKPDLIIMDIKIKGDINGIETAKEINKAHKIPVIFLTANSDNSYVEKMKESSVFGYLIKPVNVMELDYTIKIALYRRDYESKIEENINKFKNELNQKTMIYKILTEMNTYENPLPFIDEVLNQSLVFLECDGMAIYKLVDGKKELIKTNEVVTDRYKDIKTVDRIDAEELKVNPDIRFYENNLNISDNIIKGFSGIAPKKLIFYNLSIGADIYGYFCIYYFKDNYNVDTSIHAFLTIISEVLSIILKRHRDIKKIGEQKQEALRHQEIMSRNERLSSLGTLTSAIGHEIYQPLQSIKVLAESILYWEKTDNEFSKEDVLGNVKKICERVNRIDNIIKSMRSIVNEPNRAHFEPLYINDIINDTLSVLRDDLAIHNIDISVKLDCNIRPLILSYTSFQQLFINIMNNAVTSVDQAKKEIKRIVVETIENGQNVIMKISDNGKGIEPDKKDKIFEPFFSTNKNKSGTGLGLFLVYNILKSFNASIYADNNDMGGASFIITFYYN